ncbi:MAG TPA: helix-turn-helix domain-containing protein [Lacisediminihabitans sp.]|uniref:TetR/AcrR family transcriptional regulator n=1 Tax=Lacisediminihabitans sp. TaxID=2787631 RepID=UPI002ED8FD2C
MAEADGERRSGEETRDAIRRIALKLFTERGFEGTSIKDIADALGTTKSALYYHFPSKEAIIASLVEDRRADLDDLLEWVKRQERGPDLLRRAAFRWLDTVTEERIDGMRFAMANRPAMKRLGGAGEGFRSGIDAVIDVILEPGAPLEVRLHARLVFEMLPAVLSVARDSGATTEQIISIARDAVRALVGPG